MGRKFNQFCLQSVVIFVCLLPMSSVCIAAIREPSTLASHASHVRDAGSNPAQLQEFIRSRQKQTGNAQVAPKQKRLSLDERQILRKQIRDAENETYYFNK